MSAYFSYGCNLLSWELAINTINNKANRQIREVKVGPIPQSGIECMREWFIDESCDQVYGVDSAHQKAESFQKLLVHKLNEIFPEKTRKISNDDQPWITFKLTKLDRKRKRMYHKHHRSEKWKILDKLFKKEAKSAKADFYNNKVAELKTKNPCQWYSCLNNISSHDQHKIEEQMLEK